VGSGAKTSSQAYFLCILSPKIASDIGILVISIDTFRVQADGAGVVEAIKPTLAKGLVMVRVVPL